jgi:hypothetical protein
VDIALPEVATSFATVATRAIADRGGLELARRAEADPAVRHEVAALFDSLGVADLDPSEDLDALATAAELARVCGRCVVPYPVVGVLGGHGAMPAALASSAPVRLDHGDLFAHWAVYDLDGTAQLVAPTGALGVRLAPFVCDTAPADGPAPADSALAVARLCALWAAYLLGVAEHALELAVAHVQGRVQFGHPLSELQAVRFSVADATVAVDGLRELVHFALFQIDAAPDTARAEGLAVRFAAAEVAQPTLRLSQQLHGAAGLCDEYDISVLVRHTQPALRLPLDTDALADHLFSAITTEGIATLFPLHEGASAGA